jgi:hypothetical protein
MPGQISQAYTKTNGERSLSIDQCSELFESVLRQFKKSYILVDALDEHLNDDEKRPTFQIEFLRRIQEIQKRVNISTCCRLFLTSRENPLIEEQLEACTRVEVRATDRDIKQFLKARIYDSSAFYLADKLQTDKRLATQIMNAVVEKAHGMLVTVSTMVSTYERKIGR